MIKITLLLIVLLLTFGFYDSMALRKHISDSCDICFRVLNKDSIPIKNVIIEVLNTSGFTEKYLTNEQGEVCNVSIDNSLKYAFVLNKDGYFQEKIITETPCDSKKVVIVLRSNLIIH